MSDYSNSNIICANQNLHIKQTLPFHYIASNLNLTIKEINNFRDNNLEYLIDRGKLHLILDLDNTLVVATNLKTPPTEEEKQAMKAMQDKHVIFDGAMCLKLRPGVREFLRKANVYFDLSVYTMGCHDYGKEVAKVLESEVPSLVFTHVITREDCFRYKEKGLDAVLVHQNVVLIVDDKVSVWGEQYRKNLIRICPYFGRPGEEEDKELERVLNILKAVYYVFYDQWRMGVLPDYGPSYPKRRRIRDNSDTLLDRVSRYSLFNDNSETDYATRDVRRVLPWVLSSFTLCFHPAEYFCLDYDSLD